MSARPARASRLPGQAPPSAPEPRPGRRRARLSLVTALALLLAALSPFAAAPVDAQTTLWTATLTADEQDDYIGCDDDDSDQDNCSDSTVLSDNDFSFGGVAYTVVGVYWDSSTDVLFLELKADGQAVSHMTLTTPLSSVTLNVDGTALAINDATALISRLTWDYDPATDWTDEQSVSLSLTASKTFKIEPPSYTVAEGESFDLQVELSEAYRSARELSFHIRANIGGEGSPAGVARLLDLHDTGRTSWIFKVPSRFTSGTILTLPIALDFVYEDAEKFWIEVTAVGNFPDSDWSADSTVTEGGQVSTYRPKTARTEITIKNVAATTIVTAGPGATTPACGENGVQRTADLNLTVKVPRTLGEMGYVALRYKKDDGAFGNWMNMGQTQGGNNEIEIPLATIGDWMEGATSSLTMQVGFRETATQTPVETSDECTWRLGSGGTEGETGVLTQPDPSPPATQSPPPLYASLLSSVNDWRNDPNWETYKEHTDRWDRVLLTLGEPVSDTTLTPMTASEAQGYVDRGWARWVDVVAALKASVTGTSGDDTLTGTDSGELLVGLGGDDTLSGLGGNDELRGGDGDDTLTGGDGNDRFVFFPDETGGNTITDFQPGDRIVLKGSGWESASQIISNVVALLQQHYLYPLAGADLTVITDRPLRPEYFLAE